MATKKSSTVLDDLYSVLEQRAKVAGLETERHEGWDDEVWLSVRYRNGRGSREQMYSDAGDAERLLNQPFERIHFVGDFEAIIDTETGAIEVRVTQLNIRPAPPTRPWRLPGAEILKPAIDADEDVDLAYKRPEDWKLVVSNGVTTIELSPGTPRMAAVLGIPADRFRRWDTIKLLGFPTATNEDSVEVVKTFAEGFLFDLDLRYGAGLGLLTVRAGALRQSTRRTQSAPSFPVNRYTAEPLALYNYGRSATGLPLLEFLAYYQTVEYYFPAFGRADTVHRLQSALRDPRFDPKDELAIARLAAIAESTARGSSELEHLRIAVRSCVEASELREFIESDKRFTDHFCSKAQTIKGVGGIQLQSTQTDLRDQVADRLYAIRCRVVHTKYEAGDSGVELLLPSSREARSLAPDVYLMRLVAQRVLIAQAVPLGSERA